MSCLPDVILSSRGLIGGAYTWVDWCWIVMAHAACGPHLLLYTWICVVGMLTRNALKLYVVGREV
jgi:hypothetical protein